jgi:hypothetical protein
MRKIYVLFTIVAFLQVVSLIWPFVVKPLNMMSEYLEIPSKTLVNGQYVDNAAYYSEHQLLGLHPRYQRERDGKNAPRPLADACLAIGLNPGVVQLLETTRDRAAYFYDRRAGLLCNTGPITLTDWLLIRQAATDSEALLRAEAWLAKDIGLANFWQKRVFSAEEVDFIDDNRFALEFQIRGIWVLHHHNFVLGPINEYALGKPQRDIFPQYGWLNMVGTSQVLEWLGGITYDRYFKVWYSYYIIYFALLMGMFWLIFRHAGYVALSTTLSAALMSCVMFIWYFQAPGLNPVRHFFDVFMIAGFYLYLTKERSFYLFGALIFGILGILNNPQFGLACLGALVIAAGVAWFRRAIDFDWRLLAAVLVTMLLGGYIGFCHPFWNDGQLSPYFTAARTEVSTVIAILIVCGLLDILLWRHIGKRDGRFQYLVLFLLLYSQGTLLYSLWGSTTVHYLTLATIHVTTFVALLKLELDHSDLSINKRQIIVFFTFLCSLALLVYGAWDYSTSKQKYEAEFMQHENYVWNMDRAHFVSSMNPQYFENSSDLIKKYSTEPAIHIISKYDNILPFLAKKYSAMPFFELSKFLSNPRELALTIEKIRQDRPLYLFVDTDIERDYTMDVLDPRIPQHLNSLQWFSVKRVKGHELLQKVFMAVKDDYEPVEQGMLISVYRRK